MKNAISRKSSLLLVILFLTNGVFAYEKPDYVASETLQKNDCIENPEGWSFDLGGTYTWMSFTTPPTYSGSTGGILGKVTYQQPWAFFGQARSFYNLGTLSSSLNSTNLYEWTMEL